MSLYNNIAKSLSSNGLMGSISSGISSAVGGVAAKAANAMGGGKLAATVAGMGANMATNAATNLINKHIPIQAQRALNVGAGAVGDIGVAAAVDHDLGEDGAAAALALGDDAPDRVVLDQRPGEEGIE